MVKNQPQSAKNDSEATPLSLNKKQQVPVWWRQHGGILLVLLLMILLPFIVALLDGQSFASVVANEL